MSACGTVGAAASAGSLWSKSLQIQKRERKELIIYYIFSKVSNCGTHIFLFAFTEEDFFPVFILGTNKILLKSKNMTQHMNEWWMELFVLVSGKYQNTCNKWNYCTSPNCTLWSYLGALLYPDGLTFWWNTRGWSIGPALGNRYGGLLDWQQQSLFSHLQPYRVYNMILRM